jgi:predicted oxidoreductase
MLTVISMQKIYLSDSGPKVSEAVYGFYRWDATQPITISAMEKIVNLCLELGINTFDHAEYYGAYTCEELFGNVLSQKSFKREDIVLFTKCGLRFPSKEQIGVRVTHYDTSAKHILKSVDNSLKKLRTDYVDIFLLDHLDPISNLEETAITLEKLLKSGKIRNIGVANFTVFQHQLLVSFLRTPVVTHHLELNLLSTAALDNGQIDYIKQRYMRPLVSAPLANGRIASGTDELASRIRKKLTEISSSYNADIESIAVAWLRKLGALPLIGTRDEQRIRNIVKAFDIQLDHQDWFDLYNTAKDKSS